MKLTSFLKYALRRALLLSTMTLLVACHEERSTLLESSPPPANQKPIPAAVVVPAGAPTVPATGTNTNPVDCTQPQQSNLCKPAVVAPK